MTRIFEESVHAGLSLAKRSLQRGTGLLVIALLALPVWLSSAQAQTCLQQGGNEACARSATGFTVFNPFVRSDTAESALDQSLSIYNGLHPNDPPRTRTGTCSAYTYNGSNSFYPEPWVISIVTGCPTTTGTETVFGGAECSANDTVVWNANGQSPYCLPLKDPVNADVDDVASAAQGCLPCLAVKASNQLFGNPIDPATQAKIQEATDFNGPPFAISRRYNSRIGRNNPTYGAFWSWSFNLGVESTVTGKAIAYRPGGPARAFTLVGGVWQGPTGTNTKDKLERLVNGSGAFIGWRYTVSISDNVETYDTEGRLLTIAKRNGEVITFTYSTGSTPQSIAPKPGMLIGIADVYGRTLSLTYDVSSKLKTIVLPDSSVINYTLSTEYNLTRVTYPDTKFITYIYNESANTSGKNFPSHLTGITDENGARHATFKYDTSARAIFTERAGAVDRYTVTYGTNAATVTDPRNTQRALTFQTVLKQIKTVNSAQQPGGDIGTQYQARTFDANGNVATETDFNANRTNFTYDLTRNLEISRTEGLTSAGSTTPQTRTITTDWHATFRIPLRIAEPLRITTSTHDANGNVLTKEVQATTDANGSQGFSATPIGSPRLWTYTYTTFGRVATVNGPRTDVSDVTTYTYYADNDADLTKRGNIASVANALGQTFQYTAYNALSQPMSMLDANGVATVVTYDARQRITSRTVAGETTTYEYDFVGQLKKVILPDGSFLSYTYDDAHRLTAMQDNLGNKVSYTLDATGNRTLVEVRDPGGALAQTRSRVFNTLNRLFRELGATSQTSEYTYDNQGNVLTLKDPINQTTTNQYDALNRVKQVTDPNTGVTLYAYNALDQLTQVTDPRSLVTTYAVNGLGDLTVQTSPDAGAMTNTYDAAGNLLTQTDAKSQVTTYTYDALNRVASITFNDASSQAFAYDQGANGAGRLTGVTETNPASQVTSQVAYAYDARGRVLSETRTVAGQSYVTAYTYDSSGRTASMTYPGGRQLTYSFDALGRVSQVTTTRDAQSQVVVQNVAYHPFGGVKSYTLGNGQVYARTIDLDGRIASYTQGNANYTVAYDAASRIGTITDAGNPGNVNTYGYDVLDRLTSAVLPNASYGYGYDAVGNRVTKTTGAATDTLTYGSTSNRIATLTPASGPARTFVLDSNGSTTDDAVNQFAYDARGRMSQATTAQGTTSYQVNALGQRIRKTNTQGDTVFHYDTRGRLIVETDVGGGLKREFLYLGDIPVGVVQ